MFFLRQSTFSESTLETFASIAEALGIADPMNSWIQQARWSLTLMPKWGPPEKMAKEIEFIRQIIYNETDRKMIAHVNYLTDVADALWEKGHC